jgi:hypothetical protein
VRWNHGIQDSEVPGGNNNAYERTQEWKDIGQAVAALLPFVDKTAAANAGFDTSRSFDSQPFLRALTPLFHGHINPYGQFSLDLTRPSFLKAA